MGRAKAFGTRKAGDKYITCPICHKKFRKGACYNRHLIAGHGNKANYKVFNKNKGLLKKFINFIIKIVLLINEQYEIKNYIGDKFEQRKAQLNYYNQIITPNENLKEVINGLKFYNTAEFYSNNLCDDDCYEFYKELAICPFEDEKSEEEKKEEEKEEEKEKRNQKNTEEIYNMLEELGKEEEEKNKNMNNNNNEKIEIKYQDQRKIKNENKKNLLWEIQRRYGEQFANNEPFVEYIGEFLYTKISVTQLFMVVMPNKLKIYKWVKKYISLVFKRKGLKDYPTNKEIKENSPLFWEDLIKVRQTSDYWDNYEKIRQVIFNFFHGGNEDYQCDDCNKFVLNKKRHMLRCPEFQKNLAKDGVKKLKNFIENNYKKINLLDVDKICEFFKGKSVDEICKNLPGRIKFYKKKKKNEKNKFQQVHQTKYSQDEWEIRGAKWHAMIQELKKEADEFAKAAVEKEKKEEKKSKKNQKKSK